MGPGENAGVVDAGDGFAVAIRMESHNHPSAIEPYQGAATGVGGILRDIFTVGARPIALLDSLWMGPQTEPRNSWIFKGVVSGISGYGNAVGVPTVGGEISFAPCFGGNPLVNVAAIGVAPIERLIRAQATGIGNLVVLLGSKTGRDGIGGVSVLASAGLGSVADEAKRPSVQVGDPFEEKKLIEACLSMLDRQLIVGIQDLGGAGLTCATSETASKGGMGMSIYVDAVPTREPAMEPLEIMTSESQERMLAICEPSRLEELFDLAGRYEIEATVIGEVVAPESAYGYSEVGLLRIYERKGGELLAEVPARSLADDAPLYDRVAEPPSDFEEMRRRQPLISTEWSPIERFMTETYFDPAWIYRQYDHQLFLNTLIGPGAEAALLRVAAPGVGSSSSALGVSVDGNPGWCTVDPFLGALATVAESALNVACVGADPVCIVDCLNYGNPTHPTVMWQLSQGIDGIAKACEGLGLAVVGGNVSLYNEANGVDIEPTPTVTTLGFRDLPKSVRPAQVLAGDAITVLGVLPSSLAGSALARYLDPTARGALFEVNLELEKRLIAATVRYVRSEESGGVGLVRNVGKGGLAFLCSSVARQYGVGVEIFSQFATLEGLFGESPTGVVIFGGDSKTLGALAEEFDLPLEQIGRCCSDLLVSFEGLGSLSLD
jgi:phosphoribosylformylglycinamidine synthase